jgi:hypothetical protein
MAVALLVFGAVLIAVAINDKVGEFGELVKKDMVGEGAQIGFIAWVGAIIVLAAFFKVLNLPEAGRAMVILIILAFLLGHHDIPGQVLEAIKGASTPADYPKLPKGPLGLLPDLSGSVLGIPKGSNWVKPEKPSPTEAAVPVKPI